MKILSTKETAANERRVAITPDVAKKLVEMGHQVVVEEGAGQEAGFPDKLYKDVGVEVLKDKEALFAGVDVVAQVAPPSDDVCQALPKGSIFFSLLKPFNNAELLKKLAEGGVTAFSLEMIPRISRAQAMDVLSSQSNLAGYKAVVDCAAEYGRAMPLMMTAAGTIPPAKVLVLGAGVAGLQAIATARRLGAVVSAFDVRSAAKEQVESLGATFVEVESQESGEGSGGYAKEMSEDYKNRQMERLAEVIKGQDIVITTAQIPGKTAPVLVTEAMVKSMKAGAIIYDMAVESGGNCALSQFGKSVTKYGVRIVGHANVPARIAQDASQVFSKNVLNFLKVLMDKEGKTIQLNWDDDIIKGAAITFDGAIVHPAFKN